MFGDNERRLEREYVTSNAVFADDESAVFHFFQNDVCFGRGRRVVSVDELGTDHKTHAANIADDRIFFLKFGKTCFELCATGKCVVGELVVDEVIERCKSRRRRYGITAKGKAPEILEQIAESRKCYLKGEQLDLAKAANILMDDFRAGRLGRISLEQP